MTTETPAQPNEATTTPQQDTTTPPAEGQAQENTPAGSQAQEQAPASEESAQQADPFVASLKAKDEVLKKVYTAELKKAPEHIQKRFAKRTDALETRLVDLQAAVEQQKATEDKVRAEYDQKLKARGIHLEDLSKGPIIAVEQPPAPTGGQTTGTTPAQSEDPKTRPLNDEEKKALSGSMFGLHNYRLAQKKKK